SELYFENKEMKEIKEELNAELKNHFRPEFLNRLDEIIFFNFLSRKVVKEIISKELQFFIQRIASEKNIKLRYSEEVVEKILNEAYSIEYGARPIKHYIEKKIGTLVGRGIVSHLLHVGGNYALNLEEGTEEIKMTEIQELQKVWDNAKKRLKNPRKKEDKLVYNFLINNEVNPQDRRFTEELKTRLKTHNQDSEYFAFCVSDLERSPYGEAEENKFDIHSVELRQKLGDLVNSNGGNMTTPTKIEFLFKIKTSIKTTDEPSNKWEELSNNEEEKRKEHKKRTYDARREALKQIIHALYEANINIECEVKEVGNPENNVLYEPIEEGKKRFDDYKTSVIQKIINQANTQGINVTDYQTKQLEKDIERLVFIKNRRAEEHQKAEAEAREDARKEEERLKKEQEEKEKREAEEKRKKEELEEQENKKRAEEQAKQQELDQKRIEFVANITNALDQEPPFTNDELSPNYNDNKEEIENLKKAKAAENPQEYSEEVKKKVEEKLKSSGIKENELDKNINGELLECIARGCESEEDIKQLRNRINELKRQVSDSNNQLVLRRNAEKERNDLQIVKTGNEVKRITDSFNALQIESSKKETEIASLQEELESLQNVDIRYKDRKLDELIRNSGLNRTRVMDLRDAYTKLYNRSDIANANREIETIKNEFFQTNVAINDLHKIYKTCEKIAELKVKQEKLREQQQYEARQEVLPRNN
ncbi:14532_t:CDS:10, partial [Cetraspora pellucida]